MVNSRTADIFNGCFETRKSTQSAEKFAKIRVWNASMRRVNLGRIYHNATPANFNASATSLCMRGQRRGGCAANARNGKTPSEPVTVAKQGRDRLALLSARRLPRKLSWLRQWIAGAFLFPRWQPRIAFDAVARCGAEPCFGGGTDANSPRRVRGDRVRGDPLRARPEITAPRGVK